MDVITVTFNYRLNAFGFLTLNQTADFDANFGFLDQRKAIQWVSENIEFFGGDAEKITLIGHSAGAISVAGHMISPQKNIKIANSILISQPFGMAMKTRQESLLQYNQFMTVSNCSKIQNPSEAFEVCFKIISNVFIKILIHF